jgi:hypothetical protein
MRSVTVKTQDTRHKCTETDDRIIRLVLDVIGVSIEQSLAGSASVTKKRLFLY